MIVDENPLHIVFFVESMYVDKYRQAAVLMGERDVKTDVRIKKRRDRSGILSA